jgi:hypothetical protein
VSRWDKPLDSNMGRISQGFNVWIENFEFWYTRSTEKDATPISVECTSREKLPFSKLSYKAFEITKFALRQNSYCSYWIHQKPQQRLFVYRRVSEHRIPSLQLPFDRRKARLLESEMKNKSSAWKVSGQTPTDGHTRREHKGLCNLSQPYDKLKLSYFRLCIGNMPGEDLET